MRRSPRSGAIRGKTNGNQLCAQLKANHQSLNGVLSSLQTISDKCRQFCKQFNIGSDADYELTEYEDLLSRLTEKLQTNRSAYQRNHDIQDVADNESEVSDQMDSHCDDIGDEGDDLSDGHSDGHNNEDHSLVNNLSLEELERKITVFYKMDKKCGKKLKHFRCPVDGCGVESHSRANIEAHLIRHTNDRDHQCYWPKCDKSFGYKKSLLSHIESYHLRKERFKCCADGCGQVFVHKYELHYHIKQHHSSDGPHRCVWTDCHFESGTVTCLWPHCGQHFANSKLLDSHTEDIHLKRQPGFKSSDLDGELNAGENDDQSGDDSGHYVALNRRNKSKPSDESPETHINKYTGKPLSRRRRERNYPCSWPACEMAFESITAVNNHMRKHTGERPFVCDWEECGKTFRYGSGLKLHKEMIHLKLKQYRCEWPECGEAFISMSQLKVHQTEHTGIKRFQCQWPGCEWRTNHTQQLEIHRMRSHEGKKLYFKRYKSKNNSNPNSDYDYKGVLKKFGCDWPGCGRRFRFENNLQTHIKAHQRSTDDSVEPKTPKKPAKKYKYKQKYKYRIPKETKVNKKYPCEWPGCTANPMPKTMLKQHMNRHKGVKPFACDHCDKCFSYRSTLRSHIQSNHQLAEETIEREFKCPFSDCTRSFSTKKGIDFHIKRTHQNDTESNFSQTRDTRDSCDNSYNNSVMTISETPSPQYMGVQSNVIRLERIQAFNSMRINGPYERYEHHYESMGSPAGPINRSTHTTAEKLLTNALRAQRGVRIVRPTQRQSIETSPVNTETIIKELPIACTHDRCWRRFKSTKALEYHLKKYHP